MACYQPSEDEIQQFMAYVPGLDRREIIARIKGNNNNLEYAVNEFFDNPGDPQNKYRWVDGQFSSDREGEFLHNSTPSFNIHAPDDTGPPYEVREPQTRPPSRTMNKSVIDLTEEHARADPRNSVTHDDDREFQKAIEASRLSAGMPPQESGITGDGRVTFGPATRQQYEANDWAMVPVGNISAREIVLHPEPAARKRDIGVPPFLKPSVEDHRLGALFTIYHEIPLLREVFMDRSDVLQNYGFNPEWWAGKAIELPVILGLEPDEGQELIYEIQRLMAFLDKTDRSYGSVDALANLRAVKKMQRLQRTQDGQDLEGAVLRAWKRFFDSRETGQVSKLFSVGVDSEKRTEVTEFVILDLPLPAKTSGIETFYEIADEALWGSAQQQLETEIEDCSYLEHIADVITFRLSEDNVPSEDIEVPAVWYPDRYLKSERKAALAMRMQKAALYQEIQNITSMQEGLTEFRASGKIVKVKNLLNAALQHDDGKAEEENTTDPEQGFISEEEAISLISKERAAKLSAQLRSIMASIDKKLSDLNLQKEKTRETMRQLSKLYTMAPLDPTQPPTHKYTLRGISLSKNTMYVCRKAELDFIDMGLENDGSSSNDDQWWRIDCSSSGTNTVTVEKVTEENALEAAKTESKNFILVYASEKAMRFESKPLPHSLETFVTNDNHSFLQELQNQASAEDSQGSVTSPGKRKWDTQSDGAETSVQWNGGTSPKGYENSVQVMEIELRSSDGSLEYGDACAASQQLIDHLDESSRTVTPGETEVIHGVDPIMLGHSDTPFSGQEMQERTGAPLLSSRAGGEPLGTIDSMDLEQVVQDDNVTEESPAVKHIELE